MVKEELIERSPLRLLEQSIHGGLGPGNLGMIAARHGTGKTACLVHLATDQLFQDKHVIHVSFAGRTDHIVTWYEDIFREIAKQRHLEDAMNVHDAIIKNRVVMNFSQDGVTPKQLAASLKAMILDGGFTADVVIVDGYDFERGTPEMLAVFKSLAEQHKLSVWFSASTHREDTEQDEHGVPTFLSPYVESTAVLIALEPHDTHLELRLVKDRDHYPDENLHLKLDSATLLIRKE